jgi:cytochrome c oxidase subunit 1
MMSPVLGRISFWMIFLGFQLAFFPMHFSGLLGMPRRVYTYPAGMGLELPNMLSTIGAFVVGLAVVLFVLNLIVSFAGQKASDNPWDAPSLEWATTSPPPGYNFAHIPVVESRMPLWDDREKLPVVFGLKAEERELLLTTFVSASTETREPSAMPSIWPFISAIAVTVMFIGSVFSPWAIPFGVVPVGIALIAWFWPKKSKPSEEAVIA